MRRIVIADEGSKNPVMYEVGVIDGLILSKQQETYLGENSRFYDQINGAHWVDWNTVEKAAEYKSPKSGGGCHTLEDIINYDA